MRSYRPTTTSKTQSIKEKLVLVREGFLYGLVVEDAKTEKTSINRGITSTPTFVFYANNTKCLIDYSSQNNPQIEKFLGEYFSQIPAGTSFGIYNGYYNDINSNLTADLTGQYTFRTYYGGIIEADVNSVTTLSSTINRYDKTKFEQIPYLVPSTIKLVSEVKSIIKNKLGKNTKNSFNYLGIKIGDYVKFTDYSSQVKVLDINVDSDGNEYILIDKKLDQMDLTNLKTKISVFISVVDSYVNSPDMTETVTGTCIEYNGNVIISCTDNHTLSQCRFRSSPLKNIKVEFNPNTFCATPETDTAIQRTNTDNIVQLTTVLANAVANISSTQNVSGVINRNGNTRNAFYGRPF